MRGDGDGDEYQSDLLHSLNQESFGSSSSRASMVGDEVSSCLAGSAVTTEKGAAIASIKNLAKCIVLYLMGDLSLA